MKKWFRPLLLLAVMTALLTVSAAAADDMPTVDGMYNIQTAAGCTLDPMTGSGADVSVNENGFAGYPGFYAEAEKFSVTCTGLTGGEQYLLLVLSDANAPTGGETGNIVYINQTAADADGTVTFADDISGKNAAYPSKLEKGKTYYVYLVGEGKSFTAGTTQVATFDYYQSYTLGMVNDDEYINVSDAAEVIDHFLERKELTGQALLAANVNGDAYVNVEDAAGIIDYFLERITDFSELMK